MSLDIDFENFSVDNSRKVEVRSLLELLRTETWVHDLKTLVNELGVEEVAGDSSEPLLPGMLEEGKVRIYRAPPDHPASGIDILLQGAELKVFYERKPWLELSFLPKGNEFLVFFVEESCFEQFQGKMHAVSDVLLAAKGKKSSRQAEWKARFEAKKTKVAEEIVTDNPIEAHTETSVIEAEANAETFAIEIQADMGAESNSTEVPAETQAEAPALEIKTEAELNSVTLQTSESPLVTTTASEAADADLEKSQSDSELIELETIIG